MTGNPCPNSPGPPCLLHPDAEACGNLLPKQPVPFARLPYTPTDFILLQAGSPQATASTVTDKHDLYEKKYSTANAALRTEMGKTPRAKNHRQGQVKSSQFQKKKQRLRAWLSGGTPDSEPRVCSLHRAGT